jgi:hypothetical protein
MGASESTPDNPDCRECQIDHELAVSIGLDRCCGQPFWPSETAKQKAVAPKLRIVRGGTSAVRVEHPAPVHPAATQHLRRSSASQGSIGPPRRSSTSSAASGSKNYLRFDSEQPQSFIPPAANQDHRSDGVEAPRKISSYNYQFGDNRNLTGQSHADTSLSYDSTLNSDANRSSLDFTNCRQTKEVTITPPRNDTHTRYDPCYALHSSRNSSRPLPPTSPTLPPLLAPHPILLVLSCPAPVILPIGNPGGCAEPLPDGCHPAAVA